MKKILFFICVVGLVQTTFGQSCGFYKIKYTGKIVNGAGLIKEVRMPSREYMVGDVKRGHSKIIYNKFRVATTAKFSHIVSYSTCSAGMQPKNRIKKIKEEKEFIPLLIITTKNKKRYIKVPLQEVKFVEGKVGGEYTIMIDLKEIRM